MGTILTTHDEDLNSNEYIEDNANGEDDVIEDKEDNEIERISADIQKLSAKDKADEQGLITATTTKTNGNTSSADINSNDNKQSILPNDNTPVITPIDSNATDPPKTREWRSGSARGLKRVDLQNVHILVVDDDPVQRAVLKKWLHDAAYKNVTICNSGKEAWLHLTETPVRYDLVLTDLMMPGITGDTLLEMIKQHPKYTGVPVILMSGEDKTPETAASAIQVGSQDFLFKPLIKPLFIKKIATVLENSLIKEREAAYETLMIEKEEEIKNLTREVSILAAENTKVMKAIETPIEGITRTLSKILQDESLKNLAVKKDLEDIFFMIRTNKDLYAPVIKELLKQEMNPEAKSLLLSCTEHALGRRISLPTFPVIVKEDSVIDLKHWGFNTFQYSEKDLLPLIKNMFEDFGLMERFKIPVSNLERFIMAVRENYQPNPYHSFFHAFDVTQTVYCLLTVMGAASFLTHLDILSLLIAALCHDVGHPGVSNAYLVNSESDLALTYNDRSVLESHHSSLTFKLLKKPESNLMVNLSTLEKKELRSTIIASILATDMSHHFTHTAKLEQRIKASKPFDRESKDDRQMLMEVMIKLADISNVAKPWEVAKQWAKRSSDEFFAQGALEMKEGKIPIPEFMDKTKTTFAKNTANFIDLFALHIYELGPSILPPLKIGLTHVCENRLKFAELIKEQELMKESPYE